MTAKRSYRFRDGKSLTLGERTLVMGILNVTPDSFSDGGRWNTRERALRHMEEMVQGGADIIDVGAESSRPGFVPMSAAEEMERAAAEANAPVVVMHNQNGTEYDRDIIAAMREFFTVSMEIADAAGLSRENIILDPGIGFGKTPAANMHVMRRMDELISYDGAHYPLLLGASRKSFIGAALDLPVEERMEATGAACVLGILRGASIVRVHDVKPIVRMCRMTDAILRA